MQLLYLPHYGYYWITEKEDLYQLMRNIHLWREDQEIGYILEVDMEYPGMICFIGYLFNSTILSLQEKNVIKS